MFGMDSDALIKLTRAGAKEVVAAAVEAVVPPAVEREAVAEGKEGRFPDAFEIERNLRKGLMRVVKVPKIKETETMIEKLGLKGGEADVFRLFRAGKCRAIASDDQKFLDLIAALNVPFATPSALIVYAWKKGKMDKRICIGLLEKLRPTISEEEYQLAIIELKGGG
jgi:hypothetical protein